ncbi:type III secretion system protein PrgJ [Citrobacter amalonaticus]|uniref:Type III secretion system protein PrgJ n=1 Tax=Citrobacter amalonaticus TaxID=35703 RepID=A0A2S4S2L7_CITAM|nr:type III secretion system inner rod subunit SctI [Citrobacter amalonaticus]POT59515.1 type III secretion system protein PrgJ [Citrobacter amalonaticus]POT77645.1 type III secretion system protein PrgJ [Citrobacter amalonaticus]POU68097.1 type III secretion system protein PrgJ [Citrobacter amalonaticus]POV07701.1 type III secretion system protein PrgJ [Citrobacter amalonaticus]
MSFSQINAIGSLDRYSADTRIAEAEFPSVSIVSLEDRFKEAISNQAVTNQFTRDKIYSALNDPNVTSDPAKLAYWQQQLSVYTLDINLCSTLARKGVAAIETLVKT